MKRIEISLYRRHAAATYFPAAAIRWLCTADGQCASKGNFRRQTLTHDEQPGDDRPAGAAPIKGTRTADPATYVIDSLGVLGGWRARAA